MVMVSPTFAPTWNCAAQTNFNGQKILDGTFGAAQFQVGANVGETITINLTTGVKATQIGQIANAQSSVEVTTANLSGTGTIQVGSGAAKTIGLTSAGTAAGQTVGSAYAKAAAVNSASVPGLTATATNNVNLAVAATTGTDIYSLTINGTVITAHDQTAAGVLSAQNITDSINSQSTNTGVSAVLSGGVLRLPAADGRDIAIGQTFSAGGGGGISAGTAGTVNGVAYRAGTIGTVANATNGSVDATAVNGGTLTLSATENIAITGDGAALGYATATFNIAKDTTTLSSQNVRTLTSANSTIQRIDSALTAISSLRSNFGAIQSRFESTITNLQTTTENLSASRSRILDTDFAAETANMTKAQILQQAGTAILAQANAVPQNVLSLLR
jgi:flagellin